MVYSGYEGVGYPVHVVVVRRWVPLIERENRTLSSPPLSSTKKLRVLNEDSSRSAAELLAAVEAGNLENEKVTNDLTLELVNKIRRRRRRATCISKQISALMSSIGPGVSIGIHTRRNDIVNNQDLLALANGILLHLEQILAVLLDVLGRDARAGQLALLAHGSKADAQAQRQARAKEEAAGIEADNDIGLVGAKGLRDLQLEGRQQRGVGFRVGEEGHDVDEVNSRDGEVGELAQRLAQAYLCTGELGGGGGGGGGLSSRGILAGGGGLAGDVLRLGGGGHGEERKEKKKRKKRGKGKGKEKKEKKKRGGERERVRGG